MALRTVARDALNERLRAVVEDVVADDYTASEAALQPALDALSDTLRYGGWVVRGWASQSALQRTDDALADWTTGTVFQARRDYVLEITRDPAHQASAEANGEVLPGENTYEQVFSELYQVAISDRLDGDTRDTFATSIEAVASAIDRVSRLGVRPPRLRDLS